MARLGIEFSSSQEEFHVVRGIIARVAFLMFCTLTVNKDDSILPGAPIRRGVRNDCSTCEQNAFKDAFPALISDEQVHSHIAKHPVVSQSGILGHHLSAACRRLRESRVCGTRVELVGSLIHPTASNNAGVQIC